MFPTLLDPTLFCPLRLAAALSGGGGGGGGGGSGTGASGGTTSRSASHSNLHTPSSFLVASGSPMVARRTPAEKAKDKEVCTCMYVYACVCMYVYMYVCVCVDMKVLVVFYIVYGACLQVGFSVVQVSPLPCV